MFDCMGHASRLLIRVASLHSGGETLQPGGHSRKRETAADISLALNAAGRPYELLQGTFEFGQPLRSTEDAIAYIRCNSPAITTHALKVFLDTNLIETGQPDFPFYLPSQKDLGIFIVEAA